MCQVFLYILNMCLKNNKLQKVLKFFNKLRRCLIIGYLYGPCIYIYILIIHILKMMTSSFNEITTLSGNSQTRFQATQLNRLDILLIFFIYITSRCKKMRVKLDQLVLQSMFDLSCKLLYFPRILQVKIGPFSPIKNRHIA